MRLHDLHSRKEGIQVGRDHLFNPHVGLLAPRPAALGGGFLRARQGYQRGQGIGNFEAREVLVARGIANQHRHIQAEVGNVREGPALVEGQRREHRKNDFGIVAFADRQLLGIQLRIGHDVDALLAERGFELVLQAMVRGLHQAFRLAPDRDQLGADAHAVRAELRNSGVQLRVQAGHSHHEELVQIGADDGEEAYALQQRVRVIVRFLQHAPLKAQQSQLAVHIKAGIHQVCRGRLVLLGSRGRCAAGTYGHSF